MFSDSWHTAGMESSGDDYLDVTRWLKDVASRRATIVTPARTAAIPNSPESSEDALRYLEDLTGHELRSREAIDRLLKDLAADEVTRVRAAAGARIIREALLLGLLLAAYLHYYYWDVSLQVASLSQVRVFVPVIEHRDLNRSKHPAAQVISYIETTC